MSDLFEFVHCIAWNVAFSFAGAWRTFVGDLSWSYHFVGACLAAYLPDWLGWYLRLLGFWIRFVMVMGDFILNGVYSFTPAYKMIGFMPTWLWAIPQNGGLSQFLNNLPAAITFEIVKCHLHGRRFLDPKVLFLLFRLFSGDRCVGDTWVFKRNILASAYFLLSVYLFKLILICLVCFLALTVFMLLYQQFLHFFLLFGHLDSKIIVFMLDCLLLFDNFILLLHYFPELTFEISYTIFINLLCLIKSIHLLPLVFRDVEGNLSTLFLYALSALKFLDISLKLL